MTREPQLTDHIVFESDLVRVGAFRCDRDFPGFSDTGPIQQDCFVFPRTAVAIEHEHERPFAANPNVVTFYNRGQRYQRHAVSEQGDRCDWFGIRPDIVRDCLAAQAEQVFSWARGKCDSQTYLRQRHLFEFARSGQASVLAVEEEVVALLNSVLQQAVTGPLAVARRPAQRKARDVVHEAETIVSARFDQTLHLSEIARQVGVSVFHLCRIFRRYAGLPLHGYLKQLRIRHGLERVSERRDNFSTIATDLGFVHHSHFTTAFRSAFGETPSAVRAQLKSPVISCEPRC
jgi:AraC-like DNA-binding protein